MADDWIKIRINLWDDPRVRVLSRKCPAPRGHVIGALVRLWSLADQYAVCQDGGGLLVGYTSADINDEVGVPNFIESLPADWCEVRDGSLYLPQYQEHNGQTAKLRASDAKRKRASRKCPSTTGQMSVSDRTKLGPEKRREEKTIKKPPTPLKKKLSITTEQVEAVYREYPRKVCKVQAMKRIQAVLKSGYTFEELLRRTKAFAAQSVPAGHPDQVYIPYPSTWYNQRRFEDEKFDEGAGGPVPNMYDALPED